MARHSKHPYAEPISTSSTPPATTEATCRAALAPMFTTREVEGWATPHCVVIPSLIVGAVEGSGRGCSVCIPGTGHRHRDRLPRTQRLIRTGKIDETGSVTLRIAGKLRHIGVGRTHAGTCVKLLDHDLEVTIINVTTGDILHELTIDPDKDYQPIGQPTTNTHKTKNA